MSVTAPRTAERRRAPRQRALLAAKLATDDANQTLDCVIRNLSEDGALIETTSPHLVLKEMQDSSSLTKLEEIFGAPSET